MQNDISRHWALLVMAGTPDEIRKRVEPVWDVCDSFTLVPPMVGLEPDKMMFSTGTIAETFYAWVVP